MKTQSRQNLIYAPIGVVILFLIVAKVLMEDQLAGMLKQQMQLQHIDSLSQIHDHLQHVAVANWHEEFSHLAEVTGYRLTLIDKSGDVIADSDVPTDQLRELKNYSDSAEVQQSKAHEFGSAWRWDENTKAERLYSAKSFNLNEQQLTLRISQRTHSFKMMLNKQRNILFGIGGLALILTVVFCYLLTRHVSLIMKRERRLLEARVAERTRDISELNQTGTLLSACNTLEELCTVTNNCCSQILPDTSGAIAIYRPSKDKLELIGAWGQQAERLTGMYVAEDCWALRKGNTYLCELKRGGTCCPHSKTMSVCGNSICLPLIAQGETLGVLHVYATKANHLADKQLLEESLAEHLSLAVANLQLRHTLQRQATRDSLTGLFNRRYLTDNLDREINRSQRHKASFAVLMVDVDHFKRYNDDHGHDAGDVALQALGAELMASIRDEDIACRYGGEEFTVILTECEDNCAHSIAERILNNIRQLEIRQGNQTLPSITVSIGVALYGIHSSSSEGLMKAADEALYQAKDAGRDCVRIAPIEQEQTTQKQR